MPRPDRPTDARARIEKRGYTYAEAMAYLGLKRRAFDTHIRPRLPAPTPCGTARVFERVDRAGLMVQCYLDLSFLLCQRTTEIRRLRYSQVLERERLIHFEPTKTAKSSGAEIDIPITAALDAVLARARSLAKIKPGPGGDAFVIQTRKGGPYTAFGIRSAIDRAAIRAGYATASGPRSGLTAKDLRAFAASCAKAQGYTLEQLKAGLAHTTITTTEGYVQRHTTPVSEIVLTLPPRPQRSKNSGQ